MNISLVNTSDHSCGNFFFLDIQRGWEKKYFCVLMTGQFIMKKVDILSIIDRPINDRIKLEGEYTFCVVY